MKKKEEKPKISKFLWGSIITLILIAVVIIIAGQFAITTTIFNDKTFFEGSSINGINVSGMNIDEAANAVSAKLISAHNEVEIELKHKDRTWKFLGSDFEANNKVQPLVQNVFTYGRTGSFWNRRNTVSDIRKNGYEANISYLSVLGGADQKISEVVNEIEKPVKEASVNFNPSQNNPFEYIEGENGIQVDKNKLYDDINKAFTQSKSISVEIPYTEIQPTITIDELKEKTSLRGKFSTGYSGSQSGRRHNVKHALSFINGLVLNPNEEISFNEITKPKTAENGYQKATIILNGVYVLGSGGGACQASSTLYNALLSADIEVLEANKHSLPVSYVPLSLDAMVSEGYSDLRFKNNKENPIYFKAWGDNEKCYVEIYGQPFDDGMTVKTRAELIRTIPHNGDKIIKDTKGEYSNKVTYKGEYLRLKKPQEGYESIAYLDYYKDGKLVESKEIRHDTYQAQQGIIVEGTEELAEGMTLPENTVKFIGPQKNTATNESNVTKKIENQNPTDTTP